MLQGKTLILLLCFLGAGFLLYAIKGIMMPFVVALVFAYLLDPLVKTLQRVKVPRTVGTIIAVLIFFIVLCFISMMVIPLMYNQTSKIIDFLVQYRSSLSEHVIPNIAYKVRGFSPEYLNKIEQSLNNISVYIVSFAVNILKDIFHSSLVAVNLISLLFITPIVTFYVLRDWREIPLNIKTLIPHRFHDSANQLLMDLDITLSGYLRGQIYVCLILGCYYAIALSILGLESGLSLGILTGIFTFIPYVGVLFGVVLAVLIAALQFQNLSYIAIVVAIFIFGQIAESNFITPKLIGDKVGLHPVWIIFGLLALGALFGFVGVLVAVPLTAIIGVVIRFLITKYKQSEFYTNI